MAETINLITAVIALMTVVVPYAFQVQDRANRRQSHRSRGKTLNEVGAQPPSKGYQILYRTVWILALAAIPVNILLWVFAWKNGSLLFLAALVAAFLRSLEFTLNRRRLERADISSLLTGYWLSIFVGIALLLRVVGERITRLENDIAYTQLQRFAEFRTYMRAYAHEWENLQENPQQETRIEQETEEQLKAQDLAPLLQKSKNKQSSTLDTAKPED